MKIVYIIIIILIATMGCAKKEIKVTEGDRQVEITASMVTNCYAHKDYVACGLTDGSVYYITKKNYEKIIAEKLTYDCTLWKEGNCDDKTEANRSEI